MSKQAHKPKIQHNSHETTHANTSVVGSINSIGGDVTTDIWKSLLGGMGKDLSSQLGLGESSAHGSHGEMKPGEPVNLKKEKKAVHASEAHMEYFRGVKNADIAPQQRENQAIEQKVDQIRAEIKKLMQANKTLDTAFKSVQVEQKIVKAGKYHETILDFVLTLVRSARVRLEEGASWMKTTKGKKQQQQYQSMAKKHGTSFTLSNERSTATQTG